MASRGRRFLDLLVGDASHLHAPFVKRVEALGLDWVFALKENQPELLREAQGFTEGPPTDVPAEADREVQYWHLPEMAWPVAGRLVRIVKAERMEKQRRVTGPQTGRSPDQEQVAGDGGEH